MSKMSQVLGKVSYFGGRERRGKFWGIVNRTRSFPFAEMAFIQGKEFRGIADRGTAGI